MGFCCGDGGYGVLWGGQVQPAGAMSYSGIQISPGIKPMSPVSPALQVDSLPVEPLGKQSVYMNRCKFGKTVLITFLTDTHCLLALGNFSRYDFLLRGNVLPATMETTSFSLQRRVGLWPALCVKQVVGFFFHHYYLGIRIQYKIYLLSKFLIAQHSVIKTKKHYAVQMTPP